VLASLRLDWIEACVFMVGMKYATKR